MRRQDSGVGLVAREIRTCTPHSPPRHDVLRSTDVLHSTDRAHRGDDDWLCPPASWPLMEAQANTAGRQQAARRLWCIGLPAYVSLPASSPGRQERACVVGWCTGPTAHGVTKHQLRHNSRFRNQVTDSGRSRHSTGLYIYETVSNKSRIRGRRIKGVICRWFYACAPLANQRRRLAAR